MKKAFIIFTAAVLLFTSCTPEKKISNGKLNVVASFYIMYDFAKKIGGDRINVTNIMPSGTEAHDWEPTIKDKTDIIGCDVFLYSGAGMEIWVDDMTADLKDVNVVCTSKGVTVVEGDPHIWLSPENAKIQMFNIKEAFSAADPENAVFYSESYDKYAAELDILDSDFKATLADKTQKDIVVVHAAFGYFCRAFGLNQVAVSEPNSEAEPTPSKMAEIVNFMKSSGVTTIFNTENERSNVADTIANESGVTVMQLSTLESLSKDGGDYFSVMRENLQSLSAGMK